MTRPSTTAVCVCVVAVAVGLLTLCVSGTTSPLCEALPLEDFRAYVSEWGAWTEIIPLTPPYAVVISSEAVVMSRTRPSKIFLIEYDSNHTGPGSWVKAHGAKHVMASDFLYLFEAVKTSDTTFVVGWRSNERLNAISLAQLQMFSFDPVSLNITAGPLITPEPLRQMMSFFASTIVPAQSVSLAHYPEYDSVVLVGKYSKLLASQAEYNGPEGRSTMGLILHQYAYNTGTLALTLTDKLILGDEPGANCENLCFCVTGGLTDMVSHVRLASGYGLVGFYLAQPVSVGPVTVTESPVYLKFMYTITGSGMGYARPLSALYGSVGCLPSQPDFNFYKLFEFDGVLGKLVALDGAPSGYGRVSLTTVSSADNFRAITFVVDVDLSTGYVNVVTASNQIELTTAPAAFVNAVPGPNPNQYFVSLLSSETTVATVWNITYNPVTYELERSVSTVSTGKSRMMNIALVDGPDPTRPAFLMTHSDGSVNEATFAFLTHFADPVYDTVPPTLVLPFEDSVMDVSASGRTPQTMRYCFEQDVLEPASATVGALNVTMDDETGLISWRPTVSGVYRFSMRVGFPLVRRTFDVVVPGLPSDLDPPTISEVTARSLRLSWVGTNSSSEAEILSFDVRVRYGVTGGFTSEEIVYTGGTATSIVLSGLTPIQVVQASVRAINVVGVGEYSAWAQETTYEECPLGQFLPAESPLYGPCTSCAGNEYAEVDLSGVGRCSPCPETTTSLPGAAGLHNCTCLPGYFRRDPVSVNSTNRELAMCQDCPRGGDCRGGLQAPFPAVGYFPDPENSDSFLLCKRPSEACPGGFPFRCAVGYEGYLCNTCSEGYFSDSSQRCKECGSGAVGFFVFVVIGIVVLSILLVCCVLALPSNAAGRKDEARSVSRARKTPHSISVALVFMQVVGLLAEAKFEQPRSVSKFLGAFSVFALDPNVVASECAVDSFEAKYLITLLIPALMMFLMLCTAYGIRLGLMVASIDTNMSPLLVLEQIVFVFGPLLYIPMSRSAIVIFDCSRLPDGSLALDADLGYACFEGSWWALALFGLLGVVFYVIALPLYIGKRLFELRDELFTSVAVYDRYGSVYSVFRQRYFYFELIALAKRLAIVVISLFFSELPVWMATLFVTLFFGFAMFHARYRPFYLSTYNQLELSLNVGLVFVVVLFFAFYAEKFSSSGARAFFIVLTIAIVCACLLILVVAVAKEMRDIGLALRARAKMSNSATAEAKRSVFVLPDVARDEFWGEFGAEYALEMHNPQEVAELNTVRARFDALRSSFEERARRGSITMDSTDAMSAGLSGTVVDKDRNSIRMSVCGDVTLDDLQFAE